VKREKKIHLQVLVNTTHAMEKFVIRGNLKKDKNIMAEVHFILRNLRTTASSLKLGTRANIKET